MIIGEFKGIQPYVSAVIGITRLGVSGSGSFLVGTGASVTCLHPRDSIAFRLPFDRLERREHIVGVGGRSERFLEQVTPTFLDSASAVTYVCNLDVRVGKPEQVGGGLPSMLGQDVLSRWRWYMTRPTAGCSFTCGAWTQFPVERPHICQTNQ